MSTGIAVPNVVGKKWDPSARELEDVLQQIRVLLVGGSLPKSSRQALAEIATTLAYRVVQQDGVPFPRADTLNFKGATVTDEGWRTTVTVPPAVDDPSIADVVDEQTINMNLRVGLDSLALRQTIAKSFR